MRARRQGSQQRAGCDGGAGGGGGKGSLLHQGRLSAWPCADRVTHVPAGLLRVTSLGKTATIQSPPSWEERAEAEEDLLKALELPEAGLRCATRASEPRASSVPLAHVTLPSSVEQDCAGVTSLKTDNFLSFEATGESQKKNSQPDVKTPARTYQVEWTRPFL